MVNALLIFCALSVLQLPSVHCNRANVHFLMEFHYYGKVKSHFCKWDKHLVKYLMEFVEHWRPSLLRRPYKYSCAQLD